MRDNHAGTQERTQSKIAIKMVIKLKHGITITTNKSANSDVISLYTINAHTSVISLFCTFRYYTSLYNKYTHLYQITVSYHHLRFNIISYKYPYILV